MINKSRIAKELGIDPSELVPNRICPEYKEQFDALEFDILEVYNKWKKTFSYIKASYKRK